MARIHVNRGGGFGWTFREFLADPVIGYPVGGPYPVQARLLQLVTLLVTLLVHLLDAGLEILDPIRRSQKP